MFKKVNHKFKWSTRYNISVGFNIDKGKPLKWNIHISQIHKIGTPKKLIFRYLGYFSLIKWLFGFQIRLYFGTKTEINKKHDMHVIVTALYFFVAYYEDFLWPIRLDQFENFMFTLIVYGLISQKKNNS